MKISQREARRLRKRVAELETADLARRRRWSAEWPGGVNVASTQYEAHHNVPVALRTANALTHAVVAVADSSGLVRFMALPHPEAK